MDERLARQEKRASWQSQLSLRLAALMGQRDSYKDRAERAEEALRHYADEGNWEDISPPESVNTAGYLLFQYVGRDELPWTVARSALDAGRSR